MEFESPDVEKDFPGLYASESGKKSNESDFSDDAHDRPSKKDLLIGKRKDKKDSKKDRGYATLEGESSPEEDPETKSPSKSKKSKSFKFPSKKEKREKSREKDAKEKEKEVEKEKKKEKEGKVRLKLKERKKSKHMDDSIEVADEQPVFGVPLELAVERSHCHDGVDIPVVVRDCIDYVQEHGLYMEGIYKVSGIKSKVQHLRRLYNLREAVQLSDFELPVVTSLLKQFLRELPEPILTSEFLARFEEAGAVKEMAVRESELQTLIMQLPSCNRQLLAWLMLHLENITVHEKHNKMNAQSIAITLSPAMQMSHRLLTAFLCHCNFLFPDVKLNKYVPPITAGSPSLPDTPTGIADQLRKQESLLNQIHKEMNAGFVSKRKEEQLWEVQRIITQLKRKLRTVQRAQEMSQNLKSLEDEHSCKPYDDEFCIDLTLQKASSYSEEDKAVSTVTATEIKPAADDGTQGVVMPLASAAPAVEQQQQEVQPQQPLRDTVDSPQDTADKIPKQQVQQDQFHDPSTAGDIATASASKAEDSSDEVDGNEVLEQASATEIPAGHEDELQGLLQEEKLLLLEHQELLSLQADLQGRVQEERIEIERLRAELETARSKYNYRGFDENSSEGSSSPSHSDGSDVDDPELGTRIAELQHDNQLLQQKKSNLVRRIMEEREACLHLRVQLSLLHLSQESKQL
ncbi:ralA-binding protein 1 isoform X2 [Zootermopsis nevadensis]|uniref:RalA-binding protein 1 n=1 Tax=Zootermopsis nevadensis TaxID=136037 RepID=A0A067QI58_ZOONE|nr:ralA-binding protein 1 isoform X2 [Zootermopsis nevadensis]KDR06596.1 RalA-binding protein 1 [Zootermopsis nevadensis]